MTKENFNRAKEIMEDIKWNFAGGYDAVNWENYFDGFNDDVIAYHNGKRYGEKIAFRSKEACQKYCDWLNEEKK